MPLSPILHPRIVRRILRTKQIPLQLRSPIRTFVQISPTAFELLYPSLHLGPIATLPVLTDSTDGLGGVGCVPWCVVGVADGVLAEGVQAVHGVVDVVSYGYLEMVFHESFLNGFLER